MKKKVFAILLTLAMVLGLAACGGDSKPTPAPGGTGGDGGSGTPVSDEGPAPTNKLVLYSASSTDQNELMVQLFNEQYPDIDVELVSAGSGELASRIGAEAENPMGDLMIGGSYSIYTGIADHLTEYETPNLKDCYPAFTSPNPKFTAIQINVNTMIVNNAMCDELGIKITGWNSLIDPKLKGSIAFADPTASSSALEQVVNMLTAMTTTDSPDGGWDFIESFVTNLDSKISSSSSNVYIGVVNGEYAVGLTNEEMVIQNMLNGADVSPVYAEEGITLRTSYSGIIKGCANEYNARLFIDFLTSPTWQKAAADNLYQRSVRTDVGFGLDSITPTDQLPALEYPTDWVNSNKDTIKSTWQDLLTGA